MEKILISACLIGDNCKYDGGNNQVDWIERLSKYYDLIPFCPEVEGGLPIPRKPSEIRKGIVINKEGKDVTSFFNNGAYRALNVCKHAGISIAILKENSPSCGVRSIYDGYFRNKLIKGKGITASLLESSGIKCISENEVGTFLDNLDHQKDEQIKGREKKIAEDLENNVKGFTVPEENKEEIKPRKSTSKKSFKKDSSTTDRSENPTYKKKFNKSSLKKDSKKYGEKKFSKFGKSYKRNEDKNYSESKGTFKKRYHKDSEGYSKNSGKKFSKKFRSDKPFRKSSKPYGSKKSYGKRKES